MLRVAPLRSKLLLLVAGSLLPVFALAAVLSWTLLQHVRDNYRQSALDRHRTLISAVDEQLKGHIASLRALAASAALQDGDFEALHAEGRRFMATQPGWLNIMLLEPSGQQVLNVRLPYGSPLPRALPAEMPTIARAFASEEAIIGNLARGGISNAWGIAVRLRVQQGGRPLALQFILDPRSVRPLLLAQGYPATWAYGLADANNLFIAREPDAPPGTLAPADFLRERSGTPEGWYRGRSREGADVWTAFRTSTLTGWTVGVAIPHGEVISPALLATAWIAGGAAVSLVLALGYAAWLGRRISRPIAQLAVEARGLGQATPSPGLARIQDEAFVREVREVAAALAEANAALAERETLREREQAALRAADSAKDEFIAMLGHELRNPLSAITASAHVLRLSKPDAGATTKAHEVIERQARQMTRLVEDLMDVSRLAMGKLALQPEPLDLAALAGRVVATWREAGRARAGRTVRVDLAPAWVLGDRVRLEQVLSNLLDNAHKFSPPEAAIDVSVRQLESEAVLAVTDQGIGMATDDLPHVFELFVQGPQSFDRPQGGIGLGLTLVRRLVELQGGSVTAASGGPGQGACFTVRLPSVEPAVEAAGAGSPEARAASGRRVLLVEDNEDGRQALEMVLVLEGHTVRAVGSGEEALHWVSAWQPDIALVDIGLPGIDGYEVARRVRAMGLATEPKLVAISGFGQAQDQRTAYEAGFDLHLTKPVAPAFLRDVLQALATRQGLPA